MSLCTDRAYPHTLFHLQRYLLEQMDPTTHPKDRQKKSYSKTSKTLECIWKTHCQQLTLTANYFRLIHWSQVFVLSWMEMVGLRKHCIYTTHVLRSGQNLTKTIPYTSIPSFFKIPPLISTILHLVPKNSTSSSHKWNKEWKPSTNVHHLQEVSVWQAFIQSQKLGCFW